MAIEPNNIYCGDNVFMLLNIPSDYIDLTVTSPPYDNLRDYNGYSFDFEAVANQLYRVTKPGGVVVWVVADATINGSETGTSFKQALYFKEIGFNIHDTMIWHKNGFSTVGNNRYHSAFEYMFVFSKGFPKTFNPIKDRKNIHGGQKKHGRKRQVDGSLLPFSSIGKTLEAYGQRYNVWIINPVKSSKESTGHPAQYPEALVRDHIISWSNEGDLVLDPFSGSGTTCAVCKKTGRKYIGIDISPEYVALAKNRLDEITTLQKVLNT